SGQIRLLHEEHLEPLELGILAGSDHCSDDSADIHDESSVRERSAGFSAASLENRAVGGSAELFAATERKNRIDIVVWARNDMNGNELPHLFGGAGARFDG